MARLLISGATGFLGGALACGLDRDHELILLKRAATALPAWAETIKHAKWVDTKNLDQAEDVFAGLDAVIHTATDYGRDNPPVTRLIKANLAFPLLLLEKSLAQKVPAFINTDTTLNRAVNAYSLSKKQFLDWLLFYRRGIKVVNMALEMLYGPGDRNQNLITGSLAAFGENRPRMEFSPGEQVRDFIYIDDAVSAFAAVADSLEKLPKGLSEFQVGTGSGASLREFLELAKRLAGAETELAFGALPYRADEKMISIADTTALNNLGWRPKVSLEKGLALTIAHQGAHPA